MQDYKVSSVIGSDGTIYIGSNDHKLYAINHDGTLKWTYAAGGGVSAYLIILNCTSLDVIIITDLLLLFHFVCVHT